jgi:HSP20 family protein
MAIMKWNPVRDLLDIEREFDRMLNSFGIRVRSNEEDGESNLEMAEWSPLTDIYEDNDNFKLKLDIPGVDKNDVKISYSNGQLTINGERKQEKESGNSKYHRVERTYGKFYRSFNLPQKIQEDKIDAEFKNGQLVINIPKSEEAKPKQIDIKIK